MSGRLPPPRWQTQLPPGVAGSWGPDVDAYARRELGIQLDRWQRRAINRALAVDDRGRLVHRTYLISTARQSGKTALIRALIGWALTSSTGPPWSSIAGLAHDRRQAGIPYRAVLADLVPVARRVGTIGRGGLALTRYLGIRSAMYGRAREYHVYSREARDALRGESIDLGVFDEIRTQRDREVWAALEPTTTARPDPLIVGISTAGDERSVLLRDWWELGIRTIEGEPARGFGMTWYAAADELAPDDPRAWRQANPALAEGRIDERAIRDSLLDPRGFRAERLNLWTEGVDEWLPPGIWIRQTSTQPESSGRVVFGVESAPSWHHATVVVGLTTDVGAWLGVAGELDVTRSGGSTIAPEQLAELVGRLAGEWHPAAIAYSASSAAAPYIEAAAPRGVDALALNPRQIKAGSELLRSELVGGRAWHGPDELLAQQARAARPSSPLEGGDWYLSVRESIGDVDAIRAAAWALLAAIAPPKREVPVQIFV